MAVVSICRTTSTLSANMEQTDLAFVLEQPANRSKTELSLYAEDGVRSRRFHSKSRKGCKSCKKRRVKCDEGLPSCGQCSDKNIECEYSHWSQPAAEHHISPHSEKNAAGITSDPDVARCIMQVLIDSNAPCAQLAKTAVYKRNHAFEVIDHFAACKEPWLGSPNCQQILQEHGVRLSLNAGYLVHAIIAVAAAHLAQSQGIESKRYWIASALHYHHSLRLFSSAISDNLEEENADAIFACALLHASLAFVKTPKESENIPLENDPAPRWIGSMQGIRTLLDLPILRQRLEQGIWLPIVQEFDWWQHMSIADVENFVPQPGACMISALEELCNVGRAPGHPSAYEAQLHGLDALFHLEASDRDIDGFIALISNMTPTYMERIRMGDERAILILLYWLALFAKFDQWWIASSAKMECTRICARLDRSEDARVRALLRFPASICGYDLKTATAA